VVVANTSSTLRSPKESFGHSENKRLNAPVKNAKLPIGKGFSELLNPCSAWQPLPARFWLSRVRFRSSLDMVSPSFSTESCIVLLLGSDVDYQPTRARCFSSLASLTVDACADAAASAIPSALAMARVATGFNHSNAMKAAVMSQTIMT
jgi:hypothetical protein